MGICLALRFSHRPCVHSALPRLRSYIRRNPKSVDLISGIAMLSGLPSLREYLDAPGWEEDRDVDFVFCTLAPANIEHCFRFYNEDDAPLLVEMVGAKECKKLDRQAVKLLKEIQSVAEAA